MLIAHTQGTRCLVWRSSRRQHSTAPCRRRGVHGTSSSTSCVHGINSSRWYCVIRLTECVHSHRLIPVWDFIRGSGGNEHPKGASDLLQYCESQHTRMEGMNHRLMVGGRKWLIFGSILTNRSKPPSRIATPPE